MVWEGVDGETEGAEDKEDVLTPLVVELVPVSLHIAFFSKKRIIHNSGFSHTHFLLK